MIKKSRNFIQIKFSFGGKIFFVEVKMWQNTISDRTKSKAKKVKHKRCDVNYKSKLR